MKRTFILPLLLAAALLPTARGEDEVASAPALSDVRTHMLRLVAYEPSAFEMDVGPAVDLGNGVSSTNLKFPSAVTSDHPDPNDTVRARLFSTQSPEKAAVIVLGGWRMDPMTPALAQRLATTGIQTLYVSLPYQERRTPEGFSPGHLTLSDDLDRNERVFVQTAKDVARARQWLIAERKVDAGRIGLLGTSLGGFVCATLYGMDESWSCAAVQLAGGDVAGVLFNDNWLTMRIKNSLVAKGQDEDSVRQRLRAITPATWASKERGAGLLFVAAERDEIVPLATVKDLAKAYGDAPLEVLEGQGHICPKQVNERFARVMAHFKAKLVP